MERPDPVYVTPCTRLGLTGCCRPISDCQLPVEIGYTLSFTLNNAFYACMVASDPFRPVEVWLSDVISHHKSVAGPMFVVDSAW